MENSNQSFSDEPQLHVTVKGRRDLQGMIRVQAHLEDIPILPKSLSIQLGYQTIGMDDGRGRIRGMDMQGNVNYMTGSVDLTIFGFNPAFIQLQEDELQFTLNYGTKI